MKKILFIYPKPNDIKGEHKQQIHIGWVQDCRNIYNVKFWGRGYGEISYTNLIYTIDSFKPDYIYLTMRKNYVGWLPNLTNIKVPKIYVECDEYKWNSNDLWYKQFDKLYCRQPWWDGPFLSRPEKIIGEAMKIREDSWKNIPLFKWSVPERAFTHKKYNRSGIYFLGATLRRGYTDRKMIYEKYNRKINFLKCFGDRYWKILHKASALICPTESNYGTFIPAKLFEFAAAGAAVITNCNLKQYGITDLEPYVIKYTDIKSLNKILDINFTKYHNKTTEVMKNHTHKIRYKEIFE